MGPQESTGPQQIRNETPINSGPARNMQRSGPQYIRRIQIPPSCRPARINRPAVDPPYTQGVMYTYRFQMLWQPHWETSSGRNYSDNLRAWFNQSEQLWWARRSAFCRDPVLHQIGHYITYLVLHYIDGSGYVLPRDLSVNIILILCFTPIALYYNFKIQYINEEIQW